MKVIIFQGQSQYDVLRRFSYRYAKALNNMGIEAIIFDILLMRDANEYLELVKKFKPDFTLGFNPITIYYGKNNTPHFEETNIPHFVFLVDHPYYHLNRALENPNHPLVHTLYLEKFYEDILENLNIENATRKSILSSEQVLNTKYSTKVYDMVFFGSLTPSHIILENIKKNIQDKILKDCTIYFLKSIKDFLDINKVLLPNDIEFYFKNYLKNKLPHLPDNSIREITKDLYTYLEQYYRQYTREIILKGFANEGLNMRVFGNQYMREFLKDYNNVVVTEPISYQDCMNVVAQSKVTLNIAPMFQSYHDRIPLAYLNKSILCTNIMEDMIEDIPECLENTLFYNLNNIPEVATIIKDLISNEEEYNSIVNNAYKMASDYYSVEKDVKQLIDIYNNRFK